jgi:hypothetical protein
MAGSTPTSRRSSSATTTAVSSITLTKADAYLGGKPPKNLRVIVRNDDGWRQNGRLRCLKIEPRIVR